MWPRSLPDAGFANASRSGISHPYNPYFAELNNLAAVLLFASPYFVGAGGSLRIAFPAVCFAFAAMLLSRGRVAQYLTFCAWLFVLTPFIRRVCDFYAGFEPVNMLMLAPYAALSLTLPALGTAFDFRRRGLLVAEHRAFAAIALCVTYGLFISALYGRTLSGGFDFLRWLLPPCAAIFMFANWEHGGDVRRQLQAFVSLAVPMTAAYAAYQYFHLPDWDAAWMRNVDLESIGKPVPLEVRVFGTLNSPGSLGSFLLFALVVLCGSKEPFRLASLALGSVALALTLSRSAWGGIAIAAVVMFHFGSLAVRSNLLLFALLAFMAAPILLASPEVGDAIARRAESLSMMATDTSAMERTAAYASFFDQLGDTIGGLGFGINGAYARNAGEASARYIDGGPIEVFLALGVIGGVIYYGAVASLAYRGVQVRPAVKDRDVVAACKAVVIANIILQISSTTTVGEAGFFMWLAAGILLSCGQREGLAA